MFTTTLNRIKSHSPCVDGWEKLLKHLGKTKADDETLPYSVIVESNGIEDALWCCRCEPKYDREWRLYAVWCARQVEHLMTDKRSKDALDVSERFANGLATREELSKACDAARAAACDAAWAAACDAAWAAAWATAPSAAAYAARAAAVSAARDAARDAQKQKFLEIVS